MTVALSARLDEISNDKSLSVHTAGEADKARWDAFVINHPDSTFFHRFGWQQVIQNTYNHQPYYLLAENAAGEVCGILPLIFINSPFFGRSLISTAFTVGGGLLSDDERTRAHLLAMAQEIATSQDVQYIELRGGAEIRGWHSKTETYSGFAKQILSDEEDAIIQIPRKKRADLRKALRAEAAGDLKCSVTSEIDSFYNLYAESVRNLGTPVLAKKWIRNLVQEFEDEIEISVVTSRHIAVAGLLSFYHRDRVLPYYAGSSHAARALHAYDYLYWAQMRRAVDRGCCWFDFGRSKTGTGAYAYKTYWGFAPAPLAYHYHLVTAKSVPDVNPNNPKFRLMTKVWQRLPLPVANLIGPILAGNLA